MFSSFRAGCKERRAAGAHLRLLLRTALCCALLHEQLAEQPAVRLATFPTWFREEGGPLTLPLDQDEAIKALLTRF